MTKKGKLQKQALKSEASSKPKCSDKATNVGQTQKAAPAEHQTTAQSGKAKKSEPPRVPALDKHILKVGQLDTNAALPDKLGKQLEQAIQANSPPQCQKTDSAGGSASKQHSSAKSHKGTSGESVANGASNLVCENRGSPANAETAVSCQILSETTNEARKASREPQVLGGEGATKFQDFDLLYSKMDSQTKYASLLAALREYFRNAPEMLEPVCQKLVLMGEEIVALNQNNERFKLENQKLLAFKDTLESLCRELQNANKTLKAECSNVIEIGRKDSEELFAKLKVTLANILKLVTQNEQKTSEWEKENDDLRTKLKALLKHCSNVFEQVVNQKEAQIKTLEHKLAECFEKMRLDKEAQLREKKALLKKMRDQQEAFEKDTSAFKSQLANLSEVYDECLKKASTNYKQLASQLEQSRKDQKSLLKKYETSNKQQIELLKDKQKMTSDLQTADKKIQALESLCRLMQQNKAK